MQILIALLGFVVLASAHLRKQLVKEKEEIAEGTNKEQITSKPSSTKAPGTPHPDAGKDHLGLWLLATEEFHKLQCYYAIALLIASLVALNGGSNTDKAQVDEVFILLISADGLVPVALTLYTLMLLNRSTLYHVVLGIISALLASATGFWILAHYSLNNPMTSEQWPATCGALSPQFICGTEFPFNRSYSPQVAFAVAAISCDILIIGLVVWYTLSRYSVKSLVRLKERVLPKGSRTLGLVKAMLHALAIFVLLACTLTELFFFGLLFFKKYSVMDARNWGFGQIVGITVWFAVVIDLARHEIGMSNFEIHTPSKATCYKITYLIEIQHGICSFDLETPAISKTQRPSPTVTRILATLLPKKAPTVSQQSNTPK